MIHLTDTAVGQAFSLPIPLKTLMQQSMPRVAEGAALEITFETPFAGLNEALNRCLPAAKEKDLMQLSLLAYLLERMARHHADWLCERLPDEPCTVSKLLRRADYCCNLRFFRDGTLNELVVPPKEFCPSYDERTVHEMLRREFEQYVESQRLTGGQLFEKTVARARENGDMERFESINEYILPEDFESGKLCQYEFDFVPVVNFGGSEGIYMDCSIKGSFDQGKERWLSVGTVKTLKRDLNAAKIMGELCGVLLHHENAYVGENLYLFTPTAELGHTLIHNMMMSNPEVRPNVSPEQRLGKIDGALEQAQTLQVQRREESEQELER